MKRIASALVLDRRGGPTARPGERRSGWLSPAAGGLEPRKDIYCRLGSARTVPDPGDEAFDLCLSRSGKAPVAPAEFDFYLYRIRSWGPIGLGIAGGWSGYKGLAAKRTPSRERLHPLDAKPLKFSIFPLNTMVSAPRSMPLRERRPCRSSSPAKVASTRVVLQREHDACANPSGTKLRIRVGGAAGARAQLRQRAARQRARRGLGHQQLVSSSSSRLRCEQRCARGRQALLYRRLSG